MSIDLAAFVMNPDGTVSQSLNEATVSGPARLLQRVAIELLTEKGSIPYLAERGTRFLTYLRSRAATETDVFAAFTASHTTLRRNLQSEETDADPDDERFFSARASRITVADGVVTLRVTVTNRAKTTHQLILPLNLSL